MKTSKRTKVGSVKTIGLCLIGAMLATPVLGGYQKHLKNVSKTGVVHTLKSAGLISDLSGRAFKVKNDAKRSDAIEVYVGDGIVSGQRLWVDDSVRMEVTSTTANKWTVVGPALVEFVSNSNLKVISGSVRFQAAKDAPMSFESQYLNGTIQGEEADALLWVNEAQTQLMNIFGSAKCWHPSLEKDKIDVKPGYYTESSPKYAHLQPKEPKAAAKKDAEKFFAKFTVDEDLPDWSAIEEVKKPVERKVAAAEEAPAKATAEPDSSLTDNSKIKRNVLKEYLMLRQYGTTSSDFVEDEMKLQKVVAEKERKELARRAPSAIAIRLKQKIELKRKGEGLSEDEEKFVKSLERK